MLSKKDIILFVRKTLKIITLTIGILFFLIALVLILFNFSSIQNKVVDRIEKELVEKTGTTIRLDKVYIDLMGQLTLKGFYVEDTDSDTLAYIERLRLSTNFPALLDNKILVNRLLIENTVFNMSRTPEQPDYNFDFIIDSLSSNKSQETSGNKDQWRFEVNRILLRNVNFVYDDRLNYQYGDFDIGELSISMDQLDISSLDFFGNEISLRESNIFYSRYGITGSDDPKEDKERSKTELKIKVDDIIFKDNDLIYSDSLTGMDIQLDLGDFNLTEGNFILHEQTIGASKISLKNSRFSYVKNEIPEGQIKKDKTAEDSEFPASLEWEFAVNEINFENDDVSFNDYNHAVKTEQFDWNHFFINLEQLKIKDALLDSMLSADISQIVMKEREGISVKNLEGKLSYGSNRIGLNQLNFQTPNSWLDANEISVSNFDKLESLIASVNLEGELHSGDLLYVVPSLSEHIPDTLSIEFTTQFKKIEDTLTLEQLSFDVEDLSINGKGVLAGGYKPDQINIDSLNLRIATRGKNWFGLMPEKYIPEKISLPEELNLDLNADGSLDDLYLSADMNSTLGGVLFTIEQDSLARDGSYRMNGRLNIDNVALDELLQNPRLGIANADFKLNGTGKGDQEIIWEAEGEIKKFEYSDFVYRGLPFKATFEDSVISAEISSEQQAISFQFNGKANIRDSIQSISFDLDLKKVFFDSINIGPENLAAKARIKLDLDSLQQKGLNGEFTAHNIAFIKDKELYTIDSLVTLFREEDRKSVLRIKSDLLSLNVNSSVPLPAIPEASMNYLSRYMGSHADSIQTDSSFQLSFDLDLHDHEIIEEVFIPKINNLELERFEGEINEKKEILELNVDIPEIKYGSLHMNFARLNIDADQENIRGNVFIEEMGSQEIIISDIHLRARTSEDDHVQIGLEIPKKDTVSLKILAEVFRKEGKLIAQLMEDSLYLAGNKWNITSDNRIVFEDPLKIENLELSYNDQEIKIGRKTTQNNDSVLAIQINNFHLNSLGNIFTADTLLFDGELSADLLLEQNGQLPSGDIHIDSIEYKKTLLGNLTAELQAEDEKVYDISLELIQRSGELVLEGSLGINGINQFNLSMDFRDFDLTAFKPVTDPFMEKLKGNVAGNVSIDGSIEEPELSGELSLKDVEAVPDFLNTPLYIENQRLQLSGDKVSLNDFVIKDERKNEAVISGDVNTDNFSNIRYDLSFKFNDFLAFNTTEASENIFYGKIIIDSEGDLEGNTNLINVSTRTSLVEGSEVNIVIPGKGTSVIEREGLVNFIDQDPVQNPFKQILEKKTKDTLVQTIEGLDIQANADINENTRLKIIIDEQTGDYLSVKGNADFSFRLRPDGAISLSGRYNISEGLYYLNFHEVVKREFEILDDSYIQWSGKPTQANLNIQAQYRVETQAPVSGVGERMPFNVNLNIRGDLLSPELSFSLSMPEEAGERFGQVAAYINDINNNESDLNKQVMSLVLFKSFMTGQDMSGESGLGLTSTARSSLSRFLTQQLNRLSTGIEGMNINLNLESYEMQTEDEAAGVTNLEVGLSQTLFDDRLTFKISGDVYLEGREQQARNLMDYADDVSVEYELTEDGNFQLVGFRENEFDGLSQGEITRTGIGIIYSKDYNNIGELFKKENNTQKDQE